MAGLSGDGINLQWSLEGKKLTVVVPDISRTQGLSSTGITEAVARIGQTALGDGRTVFDMKVMKYVHSKDERKKSKK